RFKADDSKTITAGEWIASGPIYQGEPVWQLTATGTRAHPYSKKFYFEGHPGQFLSWMATADVPIDFKLKASDVDGTTKIVSVRDVVNDLKQRVNLSEEMTWLLLALVHYEPIDSQWVDDRNQQWSIDRLVKIELDRSI